MNISFRRKNGQVALDQLRAVDGQRLVRKLGVIAPETARAISKVLMEVLVR